MFGSLEGPSVGLQHSKHWMHWKHWKHWKGLNFYFGWARQPIERVNMGTVTLIWTGARKSLMGHFGWTADEFCVDQYSTLFLGARKQHPWAIVSVAYVAIDQITSLFVRKTES